MFGFDSHNVCGRWSLERQNIKWAAREGGLATVIQRWILVVCEQDRRASIDTQMKKGLDCSISKGKNSRTGASHVMRGNSRCVWRFSRATGNCCSEGKCDRQTNSNLVDPASSHTLVSKIKPCMCKYKRLYTWWDCERLIISVIVYLINNLLLG